jgi:D-arabinose 1-dehydrogenase-like Zn-dependent alcohol dehydrogenase
VIGSTMGTREELDDLIQMCRITGVRPQIDVELPLAEAREGFERMLEGRTAGKIVFTL